MAIHRVSIDRKPPKKNQLDIILISGVLMTMTLLLLLFLRQIVAVRLSVLFSLALQ